MTKASRNKSLLGASSLLSASEIAAQGAGFLRNLIVARMLEPSDFGVAATIAMIVTFMELLSGIDIGRYITRSDDEDIDALVSFGHTTALLRGTFSAIILGVSGYFIASFLKMESYAWAFSAIAIVPFLKGWVHLGLWQKQRDLNFRAYASVQTLPQLLTLVVAYPLAAYFNDYRAMLALVSLNAFVGVIVSHVVADTPYKFRFDKSRVRKLWKYAAPLWLDGMFVFSVLNGERVIVAREFGEYTVGVYSALILIAVTPMGMISRIGLSIGVPLLVQKIKDSIDAEGLYLISAKFYGVLSLGFSVFLGMSCNAVLTFLYGDAYKIDGIVVALIGIMFAFKMLRGSSTLFILVSGKTWATALANFLRLLGVLVCWFVAVQTKDLVYVFSIAVIAEFVALSAAIIGIRSVVKSGAALTYLFCAINGVLVYLFYAFGNYLLEIQLLEWQVILASIGATIIVLGGFSYVLLKKQISEQIGHYF